MPVTISGVFPAAFQATQNILITCAGGFGATAPVGATATFTETGGTNATYTSTTFPSWSDTQVVVTVPAGAAYSDLGVTWTLQLSGTGLSTTLFSVVPFVNTRLITSITPNPQNSGQSLTIHGSGFGATQGANIFVLAGVTFNSERLTVTSWSDTLITVNAPTTFKYGFAPGYPNIIGIWSLSFLINVNLTNAYVLGLGSPAITSYTPSSLAVAQNQTFTIVGTGFNPTQGSTTVSFSTAGGIPVTPTILSWTEVAGVDTIVMTIPGTADLIACHVTFTNGAYSVQTAQFAVQAPLALPGGLLANVGQPVHITGVGFGVTPGTLLYFSAAGLTHIASVTDWSNTSIYANVPSTADLGSGFFYIILSGGTRESFLYSGFRIQSGATVPAASAFVANTTWVTSSKRDGTYPIPADSPFPRGKVTAINDTAHLQVAWLQANGTLLSVNTPNADCSALGGLTKSTLSALGVLTPGGGA